MMLTQLSLRVVGVVKWWNADKGYGFLRLTSGTIDADIFCHYTAMSESDSLTLKEGDNVLFELVDSLKGPQALRVEKVAV